MKKKFLVIICAMGLVFGAAPMAKAGVLTWTLLEDASLIGLGPGSDETIGVAPDTTSGEWNNCNFTKDQDCQATGSPTTGSFSFVKMDNITMSKSCATGDNAGASCTGDGDCTNCDPLACCVDCADPVITYLGNGAPPASANGTYTTCQEDGSTFDYTALKIGTSETVSVLRGGGGCLSLNSPGDDSGNCGVGIMNSIMDVLIKISVVARCDTDGGTVDNVNMNGRIYDLAAAIPLGTVCGYSKADIESAILPLLPGTAKYLTIACADQTLPTLATACISGADFLAKMVAYTTGDASDCTSPCGGGCLFGTAEGVE